MVQRLWVAGSGAKVSCAALGLGAQRIEHNAGFDAGALGFVVDRHDAAHVLREVEHHGDVAAVAGDAGATAARQYSGAELAAGCYGRYCVVCIERQNYSDG